MKIPRWMKELPKKYSILVAVAVCILSLFGALIIFAITKKWIYPLLLSYTFFTSILFISKQQDFLAWERPSGAFLEDKRLQSVFAVSYFFLLTAAAIILLTRPEQYHRPIQFFLLISLLVVVLFLEILYVQEAQGENTQYELPILLKILLLGLFLRQVSLNLFPGYVWIDPWFHEHYVNQIVSSGAIPSNNEFALYAKLPVMHLIYASIALLTGLDFRSIFLFVFTPIQVIIQGVITYFIVWKFISDKPVALMAALLITIADDVVSNGIIPFPNSLAMMFVLAALFLLIQSKQRRDSFSLVGSIFLMLTLVVTHTIGSIAMGIALFILWLGAWMNARFRMYASSFQPVTLSITLAFGIAVLSWWMYASGHFTLLIEVIKWGLSMDRYFPTPSEAVLRYYASIPVYEILFDRFGFSIYFAFACIGLLLFISKRSEKSFLGLVFSVTGFSFGLIGFLGAAFQAFVIPTRWFFMAQILLAAPTALGILSLTKAFSRNALPVFCVVIFLFSFSLLTSTSVNFDSPVFSKNLQFRYAFIRSEIQGINTLMDDWKGRVSTDQIAKAYIHHHSAQPVQEFADDLAEKNFSGMRNSLVLVRNFIFTEPFYSNGYVWRLDFDLNRALIENDFQILYDNGTTRAYFSRDLEGTSR